MISFGQRLATVVATSLLLLSVVGASPVAAKAPAWSHKDSHVCGQSGPDQASCTAIARTFYVDGRESPARTKAALKDAAAAAAASYYDGTSIRTAYGMTAVGDPSLVVAIVDAYDDPNAFANVTRFRSDSHLPAIQSCTLATLTGADQLGGQPLLHQDEPDRRHVPAVRRRRLVERDRPRSRGRLGRLPDVQHPASRSDLALGRQPRDGRDDRVEHHARRVDLEQLRDLGRLPGEPRPELRQRRQEGHRGHSLDG